jgi:hypothetical protein
MLHCEQRVAIMIADAAQGMICKLKRSLLYLKFGTAMALAPKKAVTKKTTARYPLKLSCIGPSI